MMNRDFLERLYELRNAQQRSYDELQAVHTFAAESCPKCDRTINSDFDAHKAREAAELVALTAMNDVLDLYWATHNG